MAPTEKLQALVDRMPDADGRGMLTENIDKAEIEAALAGIHAAGPENVLGLVDMLAEPGSPEDVKPRYALHGLVNHVLVAGDEKGRKRLCEILAVELETDRPLYVKELLCQELGWAGRAEAVPALERLLVDEGLAPRAAMALVAIRDGAAEAFRKAWPKATGEARRHVVDGLAALPEAASASLLREALQDDDREVRIAAGAGLARLADPASVDALLKAADDAAGWERIQGNANCLVLAETLSEAGHTADAKRVYDHLKQTRTEADEAHVRLAAERGLELAAATR